MLLDDATSEMAYARIRRLVGYSSLCCTSNTARLTSVLDKIT
jgi:hypothetical protein